MAQGDGTDVLLTVGGYSAPYVRNHASATMTALCPDLLRYEQIGEADGRRGRVVRGFFWLLKLWPPKT